jgi:acyl-CoA thioesterase FadM
MKDTDPRLGWPRVRAECDYKKPLRFEDEVEIQLLVREKKSKAIAYTFIFRKRTGQGAEEVARGGLTIVCVTHRPDGSMAAVAIPEEIASRIEVAPPELFEKLS